MAVGGDSPPKVSYVLAELDDMDGVFVPIKTASRVKYSCFDVSRHYLAFGTTAGGVIILQHDSLTYLKTVAGKEGPVCQASLSPDESMIGFASSRGVTIVMEHNADRGTTPPQRLQLSYEHKGSLVTALHWNVSSSKLFVGDDRGKVSVISVTTSRTRNIFQVPTATLVKLDSKVIQLDFAQNHLLVSTMTRCYLCNTNREQFLQIGKKLRDGEYGTCFYPGYRSNDPCTIYCARPGSRMWEVDVKGEVQCTHQFKTALATKPEKLFSFRNEVNIEDTPMDIKPHATAFNKLLLVWPSTEDMPFIFTWSPLAAYVFDPKRAQVVLWTEDMKGIKDVKCLRSDVYVHFQDGKFAKYTLMTVEHAVCRLYQQGLAIHSAQLLLLKQASLCAARLNIHVPPSFLLDMLQRVSDLGKTYLFSSLSAVFGRLGLSPDKLSQSSRSSSAMSEPMRLGSGMYVVNRLVRDLEEPTSTVCLSRWRSASPVFRHHSPHSSPSRQNTAPSSPVRRKRSGTMPSVKIKEGQYKAFTPSAAGSTPDSIDSGASGKTSDFSDDTHSSPSSKDFQSKPIIPSMVEPCDKYSLEKRQNLAKLGDSLNYALSAKQSSPLVHQVNGECTTTANGVPRLPVSEPKEGVGLSQKISLNLNDFSQKVIPIGKHVSFETKPSTDSSKLVIDNAKSDEVEVKHKTSLLNGYDDHAQTTNYEVGEEATCDIYPDNLYEETYSYMNMSLYGMMVPNVDFSLIFGSDKDFQNIKESFANKLTSGKNLLKKGLEHIKQSQSGKLELLDVKPKPSLSDIPILKIPEIETSSMEKPEENKFWSFLPPFDNVALVEATKITRSKIRDPEVLFSTTNLVRALEEWVMYLHAAQRTIIALVHNFCQSSFSGGTHSYKDDDTIKSTCSLVTSVDSSPSEGGDPSSRLETEEGSISDSRSYDEEKHAESTSSWTEVSDSSTLKTESLQRMLSVEDFVFVHDPFRLSSEDHKSVSELVMMCFQMKIWGNISHLTEAVALLHRSKSENEKAMLDGEHKVSSFDSRANDSDFFVNCSSNGDIYTHDTLSSKQSTDISASPKTSSMSLNVPKSFSGTNLDPSNYVSSANFPLNYKTNLTNSEFDLQRQPDDSLCAMFVQNYFHFIDIARLRELLIVRNEPCILTWNLMLKGVSLLYSKDDFMQKINSGQLEAAANSLERNFSGAQLISHLLRLFRAKPTRAVELCLHRSYHVTPLDVLYLSKSSNMLPEFINYVFRVIDCLSEFQRPKVLDKLLHLDEVRWEWICGVLQDFKSAATKCKCGWPRPGSHLYLWQYTELVLHVIRTSVKIEEELVNLCYNSGFWKGYLWLVKKLKLCDIHKQVVIHLADISLLSYGSDLSYVPSDKEDWKHIFSLIAKLEQSTGFATCISCGEKHTCRTSFHQNAESTANWETTLHWETAAKLALKNLGPLNVLSVLENLEIPPGTFTPEFYSSIIQTCLMDKQQSALSHRMLTDIGSYMWSRRPSTFSPVLHQVFRRGTGDSSASSPSSSKERIASVSESSKYYFEEPEGHWGVRTCLKGPCVLCRMPLTSHLTSSASGIVICACGHSYHSICLPEGVCIACIKTYDETK